MEAEKSPCSKCGRLLTGIPKEEQPFECGPCLRGEKAPKLFYAKEYQAGYKTVYVRFSTSASRAFWVGRSPNRHNVRINSQELDRHLNPANHGFSNEITSWEYIDGVSYMRVRTTPTYTETAS